MITAALLRAEVEKRLPSAFVTYTREYRGSIPTGIPEIDSVIRGVPLHGLTEICGTPFASSGRTSLLGSLLAQGTSGSYCALIDASGTFDPESGQAAGINLSRLLWVRCGQTKTKFPPLEQAFKVADILLQNGSFKLIAVNISSIGERVVRKVPLSTWFRFSRVIEKQSSALVFIEQEPHAASCAELVMRLRAVPDVLRENLFSRCTFTVEVVRNGAKKPVSSEATRFLLKTQWA